EQIGFGFFAEVGFDDAGTAAAVGAGVRQGHVTGRAGLVLIHGHQVGHAAALSVRRTHGVERSLGGNHDDIDVVTGHDLTVLHVETVSECQRGAGLDVGVYFVALDRSDVCIGQQHHDDIGGFDGLGAFFDFQAGVSGFFPRCAVLAQPNNDLHARVMQVQGVGVALRAVADDGNGFAFNEGQVAVFVVENFHVVYSGLF